jgi:hypothetical protein
MTRRHTAEGLPLWEPVKWQTAKHSVLFSAEFENADRTGEIRVAFYITFGFCCYKRPNGEIKRGGNLNGVV